MSKNASGKAPPKSKSKSKSKSKKSKTNDPFQLVADYKIGERVPEQPAQFTGDFRLLRQLMRWAKRYGVLRDGHLMIYGSRLDLEKNRIWRTVNLARSVVSYRNSDRKLIINTIDAPVELFRLKIDDSTKFSKWVSEIRSHRQYLQGKLAPSPKTIPTVATPQEPKQSKRIPLTESKGNHSEEIAEALVALDRLLEKLEPALNASSGDVQQLQRDFVATAKQAQTKLRSILALTGIQTPLKWQPTKAKKQIAVSTHEAAPQEKRMAQAAATTTSKSTPKVEATPEKQWPLPEPHASPSISPPKPEVYEIGAAAVIPCAATSGSSGVITPASSPVSVPESGNVTPPSTEVDEASVAEEQPDNAPDVDVESTGSEKEEVTSAKAPVYREKLPAPMGPQPSLFKIAMSAIGRDVMQFSLPAATMQPLSFLQVMCEEMEYSELIDLAAATPDTHMRMVYIAAFAVSRYGSTAFRSGRKPFNPLLGQTFEFGSPHLGWRFIAEQVQHRPPVTAGYAEGRGWRWWHDCELLITFGGSSMEIKPAGVVFLHLDKWNETYCWNKVHSTISGLLSGSFTLDHYGDLVVKCPNSKMTATMHFRKTKDRRGVIEGKVVDQHGKVWETMYGNWSESLFAGESANTTAQCVWRLAASPPDSAKYYGYTRFAMALNELRPEIHGVLPRTDSRYRPDQKALEMGRPDEADVIKKDLEGRQRKRRKEVEAGKVPPKPLWFKPTGNTDAMKGARWQFTGAYWKAKENEFAGVKMLPLW